ncbi:fructosamine kinase [Xylariaceae sp. FL0255]|nr:fructosamine kinase [Xylariaceae sp. FL0255]
MAPQLSITQLGLGTTRSHRFLSIRVQTPTATIMKGRLYFIWQTPRDLAEANAHDSTVAFLELKGPMSSDTGQFNIVQAIPRHVDAAVATARSIEAQYTLVQPHPAAGFFVPEKITYRLGQNVTYFYMKSGEKGEMFESEYHALDLLKRAAPTSAPKPLAWGRFEKSETWYLVTEWIEVDFKPRMLPLPPPPPAFSGKTLAQKLAQLHKAPVSTPVGYKQPMFGFEMTTFCGSAPQRNDWMGSWAHFFSENGIKAICQIIEEKHGTDPELTDFISRLLESVVPRLLGNGRLGGKSGIRPVLIHGDLWEGNKAKGRFLGHPQMEVVAFDPDSCYAHSEFELGLARMFGGFSASFFNEYHHIVPKTEPKIEYNDKMTLYELYHWLNHYAIYSGGYREDFIQSIDTYCGNTNTPMNNIPSQFLPDRAWVWRTEMTITANSVRTQELL